MSLWLAWADLVEVLVEKYVTSFSSNGAEIAVRKLAGTYFPLKPIFKF